MKIPKKIQIAGKTVDILIDKDLARQEKIWGRYYPEENKIVLDNYKNINKQCIDETFIHECLEVIDHMIDSKLSHDKLSLISEFMYQVIKQIEN